MNPSINKIAIFALLALSLSGCKRLPGYFDSDESLARVGKTELKLRDVSTVVPAGVSGDDSVALVEMYVNRWVRKQVKLNEAETLFSSSQQDIDKMVEEYRQALLIRKLEQYYVDRGVDTTFTENEIEAYYNRHKSDFRLDRTIVKGRIVRFSPSYRQAARLKELMAAKSESGRQDFNDICEKNDFTLTDFSTQWVDFPEFLSYLPTLQSQSNESALKTAVVQEMRDNASRYYFQIYEVCREGQPIPLERLVPTIRRILFNRRQSELVRNHEEELYKKSVESGEVRIFGRDDE